ncbi:polymorphic toxin-type HINT domain-containing protein [Nonomuraea fuscirosea]|uniref:polymorphic toxin-type HINT domain-containing protein n=1 Tax=Nonomuraea fuscirosea TaxID=1291556 RepID=UPI002DDB5020|nr:polymorphic toxin-type HINT domain-containing protein [Nonomuraea fuscirosea]WSA58594.1 polymorphic toxin-type HINT domain-containing protein [Nonomuraea fuscirosea]
MADSAGRREAQPVIAVIAGSGVKNLVRITVDTDGAAGAATGVLVATDEHPFWVADRRAWTAATRLEPGMWLRTSAGTYVQVATVARWTSGSQQVHNLTVAGSHTYHVQAGVADVLVHNDDPPKPAASRVPNLTGMTQTRADAVLERHGFKLQAISQSGAYATYKAADGSKVTVRLSDGRVTRTSVIVTGPQREERHAALGPEREQDPVARHRREPAMLSDPW